MKANDAQFCAYLRDIKKLDVLTVLNFGDIKALSQEYQDYLEKDKEQIIQSLQTALEEAKEENKNLVSNLDEMQVEIDQLNITLLHQQKISSKTSKSKMELIADYNELIIEHEELKLSLNNLNKIPLLVVFVLSDKILLKNFIQ
jgi:seryl-tRNA synthetase